MIIIVHGIVVIIAAIIVIIIFSRLSQGDNDCRSDTLARVALAS